MTPINKATEITVAYRPKNPKTSQQPISSSADAATYIRTAFNKKTIALQEQFVVLYLNNAHRPLGLYKASLGGITGTIADIRIILSIGLKTLATAIILAHNHPSGALRASRSDEELTTKLKEAAKLMDIKVLDHLILSPDDNYYSFADEGII